MLTALELLQDNIFVRLGEIIFRQVIIIPMLTNCASLIVDIFLYCHESQLTQYPSKQHFVEIFNNTFRYLNDILALNSDDFRIYTNDIYLVGLSLNKVNIDNK